MLAVTEGHAPVALLDAARLDDDGSVHIHRASPPSTVHESGESAAEGDNEDEREDDREEEEPESTPRSPGIVPPASYAAAVAAPLVMEPEEEDTLPKDEQKVKPKSVKSDKSKTSVKDKSPVAKESPFPAASPNPSSSLAPSPKPSVPEHVPSPARTATPPTKPTGTFPGASFPSATPAAPFTSASPAAPTASFPTSPSMTRVSSSSSANFPRLENVARGPADDVSVDAKEGKRRKRLSSIKGFVRRMSDQGKPALNLSRSNSQAGSARSIDSEGERSKRNSTDGSRKPS